ncbi:hypothetical protein KUTeg_004790 [Tegillarca granosa]|uniref:Macro domain-containing protein n=1 Tax=Tegillarca granosa TaxID=220873 RepID=A0ABQ9FL52_TEGGR|nr:hypothetical protein KUTeg_004790 [Tegillarca granosa]
MKTGSEGKDNKAVELVEFKTGSEGKDNKAVELVELKTGSEGKDNKAVELVELKTGSEGTDNKAVELVEFFKNLSIKDQPRSNNDSESYKSLHGAIKSTYPKVIKQQKIENENMNNQTSYQTTSGSPCSTEKPMTKFEKENNKSPKSDKASEKSFEESHKTDSFRMIESSPRSIRKIINSAPEEQSKAFTDKQQQQQQESMQPHHPADNLAGKQQQQQSLQHHPPESNLADKQQQQQSMQPHHPADNMTGKQQQQSMQPHHPADNLTGKRQQQQSMQPHHPADMAGKQQQQSMQPHHPADNLAGKRQQQQSMQPHHPADNLADKQQQQQSLQSQPPADNFADKQQQQRFLQCQPPADTLADKQQQQQQSLQHHPPADNFADEQQQQQRSLQCQPPADNFADKQQQQQCVQSQPLTGNGAHGYYTRSKSQEEKMDTHLKGNGTHGYYTRSRSQEEGKMDTYTKGNGAHGYYTKSKSQEEKMDKHFKGKESSFNTTSQQKDIENQQTFYKVHLFFENNDSLLEIPCSQKQYYQWTFIVVAVNAEFFDSLKKYPGCKIFKQEHSNKCLTLVCENDVKPDDLKQMIHYLFVEYSKTINAVYQADIPDPKRVCELAEKKIENCKKGIVKIFCGEMTGLWIVGYNQHVYAVTKEIHDLIEKISTKCFDAAEKIDDFGSRYTPKVNEDMSQPQSDKPPNDRCMDIIDEFKFEVIKRFEIITNLRKKYPGMKITVTDTKVVFEGSPEVNSAYSDYMKEMESIKKSETDVSLSIRCMDLLHSKEVLSFIQQEVAVTHWLKIISNNHFVMYGRTKKDAKSAVKCLSDLILEKEIKIDPFYWKSEDMVTERHKFERLYGEKLKLYADSDDEKRNYIVATKDIMSSVLAGLKEKKKQLTKTCVKHVDSTDHSCFQFLNETQKLLDVASRYSVQVSPISRKEKCGWKVEGPDLNVRFCTDEVELLKKSIKKRSEKFESEKVGNFFESNLGSDFLRTVEQKNNCWIETENESYQEAVYGAVANKRDCTEFGLWKYQKSNKMIRLVCGVGEACGTEMLVDVVPGSNKRTDIKYTTELSKIVKVKLSVPVWIDGSHKERDTFCTMLNELFIGMIERGCKTVAFPFEISDEIKWNNIQFIKLVTFELNQFKLQNESVLYCTFFHPDPDRCKIAENAIDQILKTVIKDGSVEKSRSNEFYSHASTKLDMAAAGEYKYPIQIVLGELAVQQADVIVNTTSNSLALNTGHVSASIFKMGGQAIQDECNQYIKKGFSIDYGNFVETNGCGQLKCKKVYHCVLSQYIQSGVKNLQKIMRGCLEEADKSKMRSICFPAFGTGNLGFPKHISAEYMFKSTEDFFDAKGIANTSVRDVRFVIYNKDQSTIEAFRKEEQKRRNSSSVLMPVEIATDKVQFSFAKNLTLCVSQGEISNSKTDALIVFWSLNEVFNNIVPREYLQKIGESFEKEWSKKSKNLASQKCIETSAGNLGFKKIIHQLLDESKMSSGILTALKKVESSHFRSVSVALLRADPLARLAEKYAKAFNGAVKDFVSQMSKTCQLEFLQIVISDDKIYNKFKNELKALRQQKGTEVKYPSSTKANDKAVYYKKKTIVHVTVTSDTKENIDNAVKSIEKKVSSIEDISKEGQKLYPGKAVPFKKTTVTNTSFDQEDTKHTDNGSSSNEKTPFLPSQDLKQRVQLIKTKVERCRLLVHMKTNSTIQKDPSIFKLELSQMIKLQKAVSIVYPFADYRSCLLKFISPEDADHCLTSWKNSDCPYEIKPFPPQVIVNIQAEISSHILHRIEQNGCLDKLNMIEKESGAELKILESCYVLEGSLIDIGIATEIIASWINDETDRSDVEQLNVTSGQQKQDCFSSVEERNPGMLVKKPDTEKIECTLDHFKILKELKLIKDFSALKTERSTLNDKLVSIEGPVDHIRALKCTLDDISKWPKEEILLSTFPETDMSKINQVCQDISQNLPDLCIRQQENKIVVAGKYYEKVQNAKLKINLAIGRVKTTGRGERVISNPDYNSSKDLSQQSELLPEKSTFIQASTSSTPINANIFETKEGISVYIYTGDILVSNVDCIVNNKFNHKGEIAADITKQAGEEVVQQYDRYIKQNSPFQRAKICKTTAGNLKYKYILHVVGPHWGDNISASKCRENLLQAVSDCLLTAEELKMSSIAIPVHCQCI